MEEKKASENMDMKSLLMYNKLKYTLPSNLNVVERRQNKVSFADQNAYSSQAGNELVIRLTASTDYVYGPNCYLVFEVQSTTSAAGLTGFNKNTAMSLFSRLLFEDRSGAELERNDKLNSYVAQVCPWYWGQEYVSVGPAMAGQFESANSADPTATPPTFQSNGSGANYDTKADALTVCIPLRYFMGVFNNERLIPSMLISGALVRLQLETPQVALEGLDASVSVAQSYTISNPRIILDSLSLSPVIQKNLIEQSQASGGLDYTYESVYYQSGNPGSSSNFNLQINKAVSRCQKMYWSAHSALTPAVKEKDSLGTGLLNVSQLDYRLGDLYFPQRVITVVGSAQKNGAELYENSLQSVNKMRTNKDPPSITKNVFCNSGTALTVAGAPAGANNNNDGRAVHVQSFEQSSALEYSGLAINNSRTLEARINFVAPVTAQNIDSWICYLKLAKCNQVRTIIKE